MMSQTNGNSSGASASSPGYSGGTSPANNTTDGTTTTGTSACDSPPPGSPLPSYSAVLASNGPPPYWIPSMAIQLRRHATIFASPDLSPQNDPDVFPATHSL